TLRDVDAGAFGSIRFLGMCCAFLLPLKAIAGPMNRRGAKGTENGQHGAWTSVALALAVVGIALITPSLSVAEIPLASGGEGRCALVVGTNPSELTQLAAKELSQYLKQLAGVDVPRVTEAEAAAQPAGETLIALGSSAQNAIARDLAQAGQLRTAGLKPEGFVLKTSTWKSHPVVVIAGADDAGTLYGTYDLLERLGITFRLTGDLVPAPQQNLAVPELDLRLEPAMHRRGFLFSANFENASAFSFPDYVRFLDQMARMKCNYLIFWWFAYAPWIQFSYHGESKMIGDVSTKESGYHNWYYGGFGSRTIADVTIGRENFKDRPRLAPTELQKVERPEEAFQICQDMLQRIIAYAAKRNIKVWPAVELASVPPNLARYGEMIGDQPFQYIFGTYLHPQDPVNREIQVARLKALAQTYPQAEGIFLNFCELYPELDNPKHREFFE